MNTPVIYSYTYTLSYTHIHSQSHACTHTHTHTHTQHASIHSHKPTITWYVSLFNENPASVGQIFALAISKTYSVEKYHTSCHGQNMILLLKELILMGTLEIGATSPIILLLPSIINWQWSLSNCNWLINSPAAPPSSNAADIFLKSGSTYKTKILSNIALLLMSIIHNYITK